MKVKYSNIAQIKDSCLKLKDEKLAIKTVYKLAKLLKSIEDETTFFQEEYKKILNAYALKDEKGDYVYTDKKHTNIKIQPALISEAQNALNELEALEIDLPDISFTLSDFENLQVSLIELIGLMDFIKEEG